MCTRRKLSAVELRERRSYLDLLRNEGLDIGEGFDTLGSSADPCALELTCSDSYGFVCDFPSGNFVVAVPLRIAAGQRTTVVDCKIELLWDDYTIYPASLRAYRGRYYLGPLSYPVAEVLNDHFENPSALNRGRVVEGVVLACGWGQLPDNVQSEILPLRVTLTDDLDREASIHMKLLIRRTAVRSEATTAGTVVDSPAGQGVRNVA